MKLFKKMVSAICAVGMIATMTSAFVVHAAELPTVKVELQKYDEGTKEGTFAIKLLGFDKTTDGDILDYFVQGVQFGLKLPTDEFDNSYYTTGRGGTLTTNVVFGDRFNNGNTGRGWDEELGGVAITWANTATTAGNAINQYNGDDLSELLYATINFKKLTDNEIDTEDLLGDIMISARQYNDSSWSVTNKTDTEYGNMLGCVAPIYDCVVLDEEVPPEPTSIEIPANEGDTASDDTLLTITPADLGLEGDVWTTDDPEFAGEEAVAAIANFANTGNAATGVEWTISATPAGGVDATEYKDTFDFGASVESAMTIGLIVGYDTAEWDSVEIVSGTLY